jgi:hypothetical protein
VTRAATLVGYALILVAAVATEARARRGGPPARLAALLRALGDHGLARFLLLAGWLWLGWHLFARVAR